MTFWINLLAAGLFIISAVFWGLSTRTISPGKTGARVELTFGDGKAMDLHRTLQYQSRFNKLAAWCAGAASAMQAIGLMMPSAGGA